MFTKYNDKKLYYYKNKIVNRSFQQKDTNKFIKLLTNKKNKL